MTISTTKFAEVGLTTSGENWSKANLSELYRPCSSAPLKRHFKHGESSDPQAAGYHIMYLPEVASIINSIAYISSPTCNAANAVVNLH
jgi:hypothetical protein